MESTGEFQEEDPSFILVQNGVVIVNSQFTEFTE